MQNSKRVQSKVLTIQLTFSLLIIKCKGENTLRKELLGENEPELDNLGNPQPIHTAKDVKIMRSACRKVSLEEKPKSVILTRM